MLALPWNKQLLHLSAIHAFSDHKAGHTITSSPRGSQKTWDDILVFPSTPAFALIHKCMCRLRLHFFLALYSSSQRPGLTTLQLPKPKAEASSPPLFFPYLGK